MDISAFYQTFFDEADELLADMEQHLLALDPAQPDSEQLNAIFRAAHSIKGGAATFGFTVLQETTHLLENRLDSARHQKLWLTTDIINLFLETKDIMQDQLNAYKSAQELDNASFEYICQALRQLAQEEHEEHSSAPVKTQEFKTPPLKETVLQVMLTQLKPQEVPLLLEELGHLGEVIASNTPQPDCLDVMIQTTITPNDISAVLCFVIGPDQIAITEAAINAPARTDTHSLEIHRKPAKNKENNSMRVAVEKVEQLVNLVGELVITQSMVTQRAGKLDPAEHGDLFNSIGQLERNARDLQEAIMSIRMMPMEYVFNRFPRLVHDLAGKLDKQVELVLEGASTELDKSLIERIIDPLTHLVRNSLDHGIEAPQVRREAGKNEVGRLTLSAEHQGGNIYIDVIDDGAGLNRDKILAKARSQGMNVQESMSDEEINMLIMAPGFSTAEQVTDVSGRGVGMDVVKRNIQEMGGHVEIQSATGKGTRIRIALPLTLAILDGMSVSVGDDIFILPLNAVVESLQPQVGDLFPLAGGGRVLHVRGEYLPLVELYRLFDVAGATTEATDAIVVIIQNGGQRYALLVDQLISQHQVVVKNLETNYRKVSGISAATIFGDGSVALIVDVTALPALYCDKHPGCAAA